MADKHLQEIARLAQQLVQTQAEAEAYRDAWLKEAEATANQQKAAADAAFQQASREAETIFQRVTAQAEREASAAQTAADERKGKALAAAQTTYASSLRDSRSIESGLWQSLGLLAADWTADGWRGWRAGDGQLPSALAQAAGSLRLGCLRERGGWDELLLPATAPLIGQRSLLLKAKGPARAQAASAAQSLLLRLLAAIPPGKLRFTFIDPVGLGQNVAPFMHLADYDEALVTARAWTEPHHIELRLAELTEHIETVIQKYLRNRYADIAAYNDEAGEVAEPYRLLVVYDFPTNFSEQAARRLVSVAQNGPRCGVYAVVLADTDKPLPHGFSLADLEQNATVIGWNGERFVWQDPDFAECLLELDGAPPAELTDRIVAAVGAAAKAAGVVQVPFARIAPSATEWWRASAAADLSAALGPSGATRVQSLALGRGTAIHALVAGRTGSGKSTLLHTLITSLALKYSPDELHLYLIDFKKGVEFKTYASHRLPHAQVIAIESEREFGLSVLQGLDAELTRRGELFRAAGVDDLSAYRNSKPLTPNSLPRLLLLVDEFQEFFTEDDGVAQAAGRILDRLVRQGRAFGIHVLLGSQSLAGAYSLARSTIDQMGVRIALQSSEADSRLILADDNGAARLLSRPGEAIYNDANGRVEGNNPFQVAWLADDERDGYLQQVHALAQQRNYRPRRPQIVFEGNAPARVEENQLLHELLAVGLPIRPTQGEGRGGGSAPSPLEGRAGVGLWDGGSAPSPLEGRAGVGLRGGASSPLSLLGGGAGGGGGLAFLGEPIAIADPTAARFRRQSASNLLVVGQNEEAALGMCVTALISLAAQSTPSLGTGEGRGGGSAPSSGTGEGRGGGSAPSPGTGEGRGGGSAPSPGTGEGRGGGFFLLDFSPLDAPYADLLRQLAESLPDAVRWGRRRELPDLIAEVAAEVDRRLNDEAANHPPLYLLVFGLQRARDLRADDSAGFAPFSFDAADEPAPPNPAQQFPTILREGPEVGVHTLVWCDTVANLNRTLDRRSQREFEMRVAFQMSGEDSANLIDTPAAGKLGPHRAIFVSEEEARSEKFRPYHLPSAQWLVWAKEQLGGRRI